MNPSRWTSIYITYRRKPSTPSRISHKMSEVEAQAPRIADPTKTARPATDKRRAGDDDRGRAGVAAIKPE